MFELVKFTWVTRQYTAGGGAGWARAGTGRGTAGAWVGGEAPRPEPLEPSAGSPPARHHGRRGAEGHQAAEDGASRVVSVARCAAEGASGRGEAGARRTPEGACGMPGWCWSW